MVVCDVLGAGPGVRTLSGAEVRMSFHSNHARRPGPPLGIQAEGFPGRWIGSVIQGAFGGLIPFRRRAAAGGHLVV
jgi:hypothetical protein